jgi:transcriptional regulator with XRE-family HTH domain
MRKQQLLNKVGKRVKELRLSRGLSQEKLASLCGMEAKAVHYMEKCTSNFRVLTLAVIAEQLEVDITYFF